MVSLGTVLRHWWHTLTLALVCSVPLSLVLCGALVR